ncbi:uncharacterized protein LOC127856444 [Dreissena polymorpha]|uniref:Uncharacterized protein n=1 Tax=Dreissena polymorpha TaxID=45954 RepID=A0A9D4NCI3_DREPO|nr:uncharacterized protein LOC127856444 [Dreissena polymorpha]KAH3891851.1 hypothetical protein DPMN_015960 [Dreissena polymorpha]
MASLKKVIQNRWPAKRLISGDGKENYGYIGTPASKQVKQNSMQGETKIKSDVDAGGHFLRRQTSLTQSVRDVVGTFKQKLKKSMRQRKRLQHGLSSPVTPGSMKAKSRRTPTHRGGYREVRMYSPFSIDTFKPSPAGFRQGRRNKWFDIETPTRLRKEVEDLTANMQALINLTPNTLKSRASRRSLHLAATPSTPKTQSS